ncbi:SGNH/GDSL hydrolase family protein [Fluviispira sanaruensis]|uniref:GDSL family lipase n=1 Tax=Fluviispira sanaruensis TaxID=2493639 RepID=A0A4P2VHH5_FLUSA|nr:SGNH/GDSL hydrolase family protein [Fluviispira sanaruensis]BBH52356.1 GDSL family lipase [Fluviispira sanaruensis]
MLKKGIAFVVMTFLYSISFAQESKNEIKNVIIFGDSLSDNGNYFQASATSSNRMPLPPYYKGRATNGFVWSEYFANSIQAKLINFAYLGAMTSGINARYPFAIPLLTQVENFIPKLKSGELKPANTLFVVWAGSNNIFTLDFNKPVDSLMSLWNLSFDIANSILLLKENGALNILVANLPDLGKIALNNEVEVYRKLSFMLSYISRAENLAVKTRVRIMNETKKNKDFKLLYFDAKELLEKIRVNPNQYNIKNSEKACYLGVPSTPANPNVACQNPRDYLFWDLVHPTTRVHCIAAYEIQMLLAKEALVKMPDENDLKKCTSI